MSASPPPTVLMVDDDLAEHARIRGLLPDGVPLVSAYSAVQGIDRCRRLVAERPERAIVLILDFRLPDMDGAMLAAKLRELLPEAPIIALSSLSQIGPLMGISGVTRSLVKSLSDAALREQLAEVLMNPQAAPADPLLAPYLAGHATTLALMRAQSSSVAVLASSRQMLQLLADALQQAGVTVGAQSTSPTVLQVVLGTLPVQSVVCDGPIWSRARSLAEGQRLPLLVVAMSLSAAVSLSIEPVGLAVLPEPGTLQEGLERLAAGQPYTDPRVTAAYDRLELSQTERLILAYILRDRPIEQVAQALHLSEGAARKARLRTLARLRADGVDEVRTILDELLLS